jgi:glucose-1-phosphate adenylyltransferase
MDYRKMLYYHLEKDADLTIAFAQIDPAESSRFGVAGIDDEDGDFGGKVLQYMEKPAKDVFPWASLTIYMFKPKVLYEVLETNSKNPESHEFGRNIIPKMVARDYRVYGFKFRGYWGYTRTIAEYWQTNLSLLDEKPSIDLDRWQVRTNLDHDRLRDRAPAEIGGDAQVDRALIHNGCSVEGRAENSILFPGVRVEKGAVVRNSILFFDTVVQRDALVDNAITDFEVNIGQRCIVGEGENDTPNELQPELLNSGITLIGKGIAVPANAIIGRNCILYPGLKQMSFSEPRIESGRTLR